MKRLWGVILTRHPVDSAGEHCGPGRLVRLLDVTPSRREAYQLNREHAITLEVLGFDDTDEVGVADPDMMRWLRERGALR